MLNLKSITNFFTDVANEAQKKKSARAHTIMKFKRGDAIPAPSVLSVPQTHLDLGI